MSKVDPIRDMDGGMIKKYGDRAFDIGHLEEKKYYERDSSKRREIDKALNVIHKQSKDGSIRDKREQFIKAMQIGDKRGMNKLNIELTKEDKR